MVSDTVALILAGLTTALLVLGIAQLVIGLMPSDEQRVKDRLGGGSRGTGGGGGAGTAGTSSILLRRPELRGGPDTGAGRFERRMQLVYPEATVGKFAAVCLAAAALLGGLLLLATGPLLGLVGALGGAMLPLAVLSYKRSRRERILGEQLIEALDFLARILRAGHSLAIGLKMCGEELPEPIASEFARCYDQHTLGQTIEESLTAMAARMDLTDFNFFVTSIVIQRQTGGDLAEILDNIAKMIRNRIQLNLQVKALTSEGRATGAVLTALPVFIFIAMMLLNRKYASVLLTHPQGQMLTAVMVVLLVIGQLLIQKIVTIKV